MKYLFFILLFLLNSSLKGDSTKVNATPAVSSKSFESVNLSENINTFADRNISFEVRRPGKEILNKYRVDESFNYNSSKNPETLLEIISYWINEQLYKFLRSKAFYYFSEYLGYIIALLAVIIVFLILRKSKLQGIMYGSPKKENGLFNEIIEDINQLNLDELIKEALGRSNFRLAIRYSYLKALKILTEKKHIDWEINKTNSQYLKEIKEPEIKKSFKDLTLLFEWIWYGENRVEEKIAKDAINYFDNFYLTAGK